MKIKTRGARATYKALEPCLSYARDLMIPDRRYVFVFATSAPNTNQFGHKAHYPNVDKTTDH